MATWRRFWSAPEEISQPKRRQNLIEEADAARVSKQLVTLRDDVPVKDDLDSFAVKAPEPDVLLGFLEEQAFKSLLAATQGKLGVAPETPPGHRAPAEAKASDGGGYELVQTDRRPRGLDRSMRPSAGRRAPSTPRPRPWTPPRRIWWACPCPSSPGARATCRSPTRRPAAQGALDLDGGDDKDADKASGKAGGDAPKQIPSARRP